MSRRCRLLASISAALLAAGSSAMLSGCRSGLPSPAPPTSLPPATGRAPESGGRSGHPRLFLSADILERLKKKAAAREADWTDLIRRADRYAAMAVAPYDRNATPPDTIGYSYQGFGWLDAFMSLGIVYNVTGAKKYATKIVELLHLVNTTTAAGNLEPITADSGFPSRSAALGVALAFDWIYVEISPADRAATISTLNRWFDWHAASAFEHDGPVFGNYFGGHLLGFGAAGYATAGDNDRADQIIDYERRRFEDVVVPAFANGLFSGGFPTEGYVYGTNHYERLFQYAMMGAATGQDAGLLREDAAKTARNLLHALKPNRWQVPDEAAYPGENTGVLALGLPVLLSHLLDGTPLGANVQYLLQTLGHPPEGITLDRPGLDWLLYWDPARRAVDAAASEPLYFHSAGDEHLFMRSSWAPDAVWASFTGGLSQISAHQARAAGHLAIQRGNDMLLIYAGQWKGADGLSGRPQQYQTTSAYANTLFVSDGGAYLYDGERYLGGQSPWAQSATFPYLQTDDLTWGKLDATPIYDRKPGSEDPKTRSLRRFVRNFVYLRPALFVVFDRVRVLKREYVHELRFHLGTKSEPVLAGNVATSIVGSSALHIRALLPRAASLKVAWNTAEGQNLNARLAVTTASPETDLDALEIITVGQRDERAPDAVLLTANGDTMLGAQVKKSNATDRDHIVLFGAAPTGIVPTGTTVHYRITATGPSRHHLFDLEPKHKFAVRASTSSAGMDISVASDGPGVTVMSNSAGALQFDLVGSEVRALP